jgi:hypothetical protein
MQVVTSNETCTLGVFSTQQQRLRSQIWVIKVDGLLKALVYCWWNDR